MRHRNIPINNTLAVEVFQGQENFTGIEFRLTQRELFLLNVQHEITAADVFHHKVNSSLGLETRVQLQ